MVLAGNKSDLPAENVRVSQSMARELAKEHNMYWAEVSAKTGAGVEKMFNHVAQEVIRIRQDQAKDSNNNVF